jgi:hypothetical protein
MGTETLTVVVRHIQASRYVSGEHPIYIKLWMFPPLLPLSSGFTVAAGLVVCISACLTNIARDQLARTQVLLYDHILTFDQELRLIWRTKITMPKILFLFNRYTVPVVMIIRTTGN